MTSSHWADALAIIVLLVGAMALLSAAARRALLRPEAARKSLHLSMGLVTVAFPWWFDGTAAFGLFALLCAGWFAAVRCCGAMHRTFGGVLRSVGRASYGDFAFLAGISAVYVLSDGAPLLYCTPVLILSVADSAAALVGTRFAPPVRPGRWCAKSAAGSAAFFVSALACALAGLTVFGNLALPAVIATALLTASLTTIAEALCGRGLDNLVIPLAAFVALDEPVRLAGTPLLVVAVLALGAVAGSNDAACRGPASS